MSVLKYEHENSGEEAMNSIMGILLREISSETLDLAFLGILGIKTTLISDSRQGIRQILQTSLNLPSMVSLYHVL